MIAHLRGRGKALWPLGHTGPQAEWIALACLHGGRFTRHQLSAYLRIGRSQGHRVIRAMAGRRIAVVDTIDGRRVCRISNPRIYRALGLRGYRGRRETRGHFVMRRLLSLDYVLDHRQLPWLPTEAEQIRAFESLGIARALLPTRRWAGRPGAALRYFPHAFPIALGEDDALFAFIDPGFTTGDALRAWGKKHRPLWEALQEHGRAVRVAAVVRTVRDLQRARTTLEHWCRPPQAPSTAECRAARLEIERIERAILGGDEEALLPYGDIRGGLRRLTALRKLERRARPRGAIDAFGTWRSTRLPGDWL